MKSIFIGSVSEYSGKNLISLGVARHFIDKHKKVGYFKPIGISPVDNENIITDEDVLFFKKVLGVHDPLSQMCPVVLTSALMNELYAGVQKDVMKKVKDAYGKVSADKDVTLISGFGDLSSGCASGCSQVHIIKEMDAKAIIIDRFVHEERDMVDWFVYAKDIIGERLLGVVFNMVSESRVEFVRSKIVPFLRTKGIATIGIVPEDPILHAVPVRDIVQQLSGKVLCCEEELDNLVEKLVVGAMTVDSALKYFRKVSNKAVVTGGDRGDIQLAAMETSTRCLILTGDLYPHQNIVTAAVEKKIPIVVVPHDTLTTIGKFETVLGHLGLRDEKKIDRALGIISNCIDFKLIDTYINK